MRKRAADQLGDEATRARAWICGVVVSSVVNSSWSAEVAEAAGEDAAVAGLLPVVEAVPAVVRAVEDPLRRAARWRSSARGSGRSAPRSRPAGRSGSRRWRRGQVGVDASSESTRLCSLISTPASAARTARRRTQRAGCSAASAGWKIAARKRPAAGSSIHSAANPSARSGLVLDRELVALLVVGGEPEAAGPAGGIAGEPDEPVERLLGLPPVVAGRVAADRLDGDVVGRRAAAEGEAAVPAACPAGDLAGVVQADLQAGLGEPSAAAQPVTPPPTTTRRERPSRRRCGNRRRRLVEPVAGQLSAGSPSRAARRRDYRRP